MIRVAPRLFIAGSVSGLPYCRTAVESGAGGGSRNCLTMLSTLDMNTNDSLRSSIFGGWSQIWVSLTSVPATMLGNDTGIMLSQTRVFSEFVSLFLHGSHRESFKIFNDNSHFFDIQYARIIRKN
ncbi:hypothetical protein BYT27DRAFT_6689062 [Phlegmacium glaucopus]|nr:hypothetical protein BYT27DRAFT_6689062 [Phlegmacium glaucopus]